MLLLSAPARAEAFRPPGQSVPVFDTTLHLLCTGAGPRTVVLEAGLAGNHLDWWFVQPALAAAFRVCSYDRAGAGFSARTSRPRGIGAIAEELHKLVLEASVARPFILVGHSFGGLVGLAYARTYPADVAGLVLLDAMHQDQFDRFAAAGIHIETDPLLVLGRTSPYAALHGLPDALAPLALALAQSDNARVFAVREMSLMLESARAVRDAGLPRLPSRVLVHGNDEWAAVPPAGRMEPVWRALQADLALALGAPPPIVVPDSGHQIALDAPGAVVAAVRDLAAGLP